MTLYHFHKHAKKRALSLKMYLRELCNVITPRRETSNVIIEQDGRQKVEFLRRDDQFFTTLNDWPWQWKHTETIENWHVRYEIWELNSHGSAFFVPNPRGPLKSPFGSALQTRWVYVRLIFIWLNDTYRWGVVLQQKFPTLTSNFVEMLCLINSENHVTLAAIFLT